MDDNGLVYKAATNPALAVRLAGGSGYPRPGYPEKLVWRDVPDLISLQEALYNAIKQLISVDRDVILARFAEECTLREYGDRINRSRERVRQLESRSLRRMLFHLQGWLDKLREATEVVAEPGSALDPDWIGTKEAAEITSYTRGHICYLCRTGRVVSQVNPLKRNHLQVSQISLAAYIVGGEGDGRRTGEWRENDEQA